MGDKSLEFSQSDADQIYDELRTLHIELDADPLSFGPKRLNKKVSQVRRLLDRCERIFLDVAQRLHRARREFRQASTHLEISKKYLFANDPETRSGRSVGDREAIATGKLKDEVDRVNKLDLLVQDLDTVLGVVRAKRSDLRDTQGRLRDQIRLCQEEIGLGNRWGSRTPGEAPKLQPSKISGSDDIDNLLQGVDGEIHLGSQEGTWDEPEEFQSEPDSIGDDSKTPDEVLPSTASEDEVESFLSDDSGTPAPKKTTEETTELPPEETPSVSNSPDLDIDQLLDNFESLD